jgi:hypothetical protein
VEEKLPDEPSGVGPVVELLRELELVGFDGTEKVLEGGLRLVGLTGPFGT